MLASRVKRRIAAEFRRWSQRGPVRRRVYFKLMSEPFAREQSAVSAGIGAYGRERLQPGSAYLLRRNVHMIEKGLTMRPRRGTFAADYIEETVGALEGLAPHEVLELGREEFDWVLSVLDEYFSATGESQSQAIQRSHLRYRDLAQQFNEFSRKSGPRPPGAELSGVEIGALARLAESRRSVRWFEDRPVSRNLLDRAFEVARESPTACNRQPYRFEVFDDKESVRQVASVPMGTVGYADQIPGIVVVIGDLSAFFDERDRHLIYIDGCLASMGLILALEAQGVSTCCVNWPDIPERDQQMRELLNLSEHERVVMLVAFGYADPNGLAPFSAKRDLSSVRRYSSI